MKPFVFVLMPFDPKFNDIYKLGIKSACIESNAYCERVDEQIYEERMLDRIYNQIDKADIIISDMTGKNSNVFYETGFAHGLQKRVILITQNSDDIPFDLKHFHHIIYGGSILKLKEELLKKIQYFINNPSQLKLPNTKSLQFFINGNEIVENEVIGFFEELKNLDLHHQLVLHIDIYNSSEQTFKSELKIGLELDFKGHLDVTQNTIIIKQENKRFLHLKKEPITNIFPKGWTKVSFIFDQIWDYIELDISKATKFPITMKLFNDLGVSDKNFFLDFSKRNF